MFDSYSDLSTISAHILGLDSELPASQLDWQYDKILTRVIVFAYFQSLKTPINSYKSVTIDIQVVEKSPRVKVIWNLARHVNFGRSCVSELQVSFPEEVRGGAARNRQRYLLGSILLKICEKTTGKIDARELFKGLESGKVSGNLLLVGHWQFICSCLSYKFARRAYIQGRQGDFKSALRYTAVGGLAIGAGCLAVPAVFAAAGFTASGVLAGSVVAKCQSLIGAVAAGGWFAQSQSFAATGFVALQTLGEASGVLAAVTAVVSQVVPEAGNVPYQRLYDSDLIDYKTLDELLKWEDFMLVDID